MILVIGCNCECQNLHKKKKYVSVGIQVDMEIDVTNHLLCKKDLDSLYSNLGKLTSAVQQHTQKVTADVKSNSEKLKSQFDDFTNYLKSSENKTKDKFISFKVIQDLLSCNLPLVTDADFQVLNNNIKSNNNNIREVLVSLTFFTKKLKFSSTLNLF